MGQLGGQFLRDDRVVVAIDQAADEEQKFLDGLADDMEQRASRKQTPEPQSVLESGDTTPTIASEKHARSKIDSPRSKQRSASRKLGPAFVHDAVVNVVLSPKHIASAHTSSSNEFKASLSDDQIQANMIVSIWNLENQRYFTLTFTSTSSASAPTPKAQSRPVSRYPPSSTLSPSSEPSPASSIGSRTSSTSGSAPGSVIGSPAGVGFSAAPLLPLGGPSRASVAAAPSILQKITRMKDAILNSMELPIFAMWKDQSLAFPNKAAAHLMHATADPDADDQQDILERFKVYSQNFERQLRPDEYPIAELCRSQKPFTGWKIGVIDSDMKRVNYDVSGEGIFDEKTGEFLAGIVVLKDVTEYTSELAAKDEQNDQQFQLICETMPQLLWTTTATGRNDWFSRRWYDYTGTSVQESMTEGWESSFHPDEIAETARKWQHCLKTGEEFSTEYRCKRHDGAWRWMLGRALPLRDQKTGDILKWFGTCTDIHELVEARQSARRTREQLLNVIAHAHVTVWAIDKEKRLTFLEGRLMWDEGMQDLSNEHIGQNVYDGTLRLSSALEPLI